MEILWKQGSNICIEITGTSCAPETMGLRGTFHWVVWAGPLGLVLVCLTLGTCVLEVHAANSMCQGTMSMEKVCSCVLWGWKMLILALLNWFWDNILRLHWRLGWRKSNFWPLNPEGQCGAASGELGWPGPFQSSVAHKSDSSRPTPTHVSCLSCAFFWLLLWA